MTAANGTAFDVRQLPALLNLDATRLQLARQRQAAVWRREKPDAWPIFLHAPLTAPQQAIPNPNLAEAFADADLMLCSQVRAACAVANSRADGVPSIRVNFGTAVCLSVFGLEAEVFPDKMPWLQRHLTRDEVAKLTPDDILPRGSLARAFDYIDRFRAVLGDALPVYCLDTQGPFDLAHLLLGDDIFYLMTDDPGLVHHAMELCLELGIRAHTWVKERAGEPLTRIHHGNELYAENMGVRICEDTSAIVSPATLEEFAMPYTRRLAQHFGGAWVHYCGRSDPLTRAILEIPEVRGINFGHVPGHEHDHVFAADMARIAEAGKVYYGSWPRLPRESGADFLRRLHGWAERGALLPSAGNAVGDNGFADVAAARDFWYSL